MEKIKVLKNDDEFKDKSDIEVLDKFYKYLQNDLKLSSKKAFRVILYLQEHIPVLPDNYERCTTCNNLYDTWAEGNHDENRATYHCGGCIRDYE